MQELEAIRQCQAGEQEALGVLFELHHKSVFRTAFGITHNYDMAEDVTQQVFLELFTAIKRYDARRPFLPWLRRIAVHKSLDGLRKPANRYVPIGYADDLPSPALSPDDEAEKSELRATMLEALGDLSPKHRAVVVMYYYQDFSVAEISKALGCFRKTVRTRLHYARAHLGEILESRASPITGPSLSNPETHRNGRTAEPVPGPYIPAEVEVEPW